MHCMPMRRRRSDSRTRLRRATQSWRRIGRSHPLAAGLFLSIIGFPGAADEPPQRSFLFVYSAHSTLAANVLATEGVAEVLDKSLDAGYEVYAEYRDITRFPGEESEEAFAESMARKYRGMPFDAILVFGTSALRFVLEHRADLGLDAPIVFGGVTRRALAGIDLPPDAVGICGEYTASGTLALARGLQPDAKRVVVMSGSGDFDHAWEEAVRLELAGVDDMPIEYVSGLTLDGFRRFAAGLDRETILIMLTVHKDSSGRGFTPVNATALIAVRSGAPVWAIFDSYIGHGAVGGKVQFSSDIGAEMARTALRLVNGDGTVERLIDIPQHNIVDWRQVQRFGLDAGLLPDDALIEFHTPTGWERHRTQVLIASAIIILQAATIAALAIQGRRRRGAESDAAAGRMELAHMSRVAQLGELSGALAHELNQPLTSILANAEAGVELAARNPVDTGEIAAILADIVEDDRRAAKIIVELRRLMTKGEMEFERLDLGDVVTDTVRLAHSEMLVRAVTVDVRQVHDGIEIRGNLPQLKQVVLNLLLNAADAMANQPVASRVVTLITSVRGDGWRELWVLDRGPGLEASVAADPFRAFVTTKRSGLGLGLSICRAIVQAHGGTLAFDIERANGACVVMTLPPP